jgi:hypothetical protein
VVGGDEACTSCTPGGTATCCGLADGAGLPSALPVDETTLGRLFGRGANPATGAALGRARADARVQAEVLAARHAAVQQVLGWVEREMLLTRTGLGGATPQASESVSRTLSRRRRDHGPA